MSFPSEKSGGRPFNYEEGVPTDANSMQAQNGPGRTPASSGAHTVPDLDTLYAEQFQFVWRSLRRLGVAEPQLDDASQDVFVAVHRRLHEYEPRCSPKAWLFAIARRVASDYRRTVRRKGGLAPLSNDTVAGSTHGPLESAIRNQASRVVLEFLEQVAPEQREVFILAELEQMTAPEIAEALALNQNTIYSRVRSARRALQDFVLTHYPDLMEDIHG